jgi:aminoglycoside phosphotransferase (APT) family kinase protein
MHRAQTDENPMSDSDINFLPDVPLAAYLEKHLAGFRGPLTATKFKGGQSNPTYRLEAASGSCVLRRKPSGKLLASAHAVDREFRVLTALYGCSVPVARPLHLCTDETVIGSMFYVMEFVPGRVLWDPALPKLASSERRAYYEAMIDILIALARIDVVAVGLGEYGKPGNFFTRQIRRWTEQYHAAATEQITAMDQLIAWLPANAPPEDNRVALVHGDFRIDNLMWHADSPTLLAVVDWELSTLGHPLADLAYFCMALRLPPGGAVLSGLAGMDRHARGIPDEAELIARYSAGTGLSAGEHWSFYLAFNFFRLAAIAQGVYKRAQQGNASSDQALQAGAMARAIAELGWQAATADNVS